MEDMKNAMTKKWKKVLKRFEHVRLPKRKLVQPVVKNSSHPAG